MKLPEHEQASIPERKITGYLLSLSHRDGRSKAAFFMQFGFALHEWALLSAALKRHAADNEIAAVEPQCLGRTMSWKGHCKHLTAARPASELYGMWQRTSAFPYSERHTR